AVATVGAGPSRGTPRHDVLNTDGAPDIGVKHARVTPDALREPVERERRDLPDDLVLRGAGDPAPRHAGAEPRLDRAHARLGALEAHGAAELLGLPAREARDRHGDAQALPLAER